MPTIMVINVTHSEESRVAILKEGVLEAFEIEALSREHLKGNIYKGVVHRIHPALEAAFVDIGAERDAFLPLDEICFRNLAQPLPQPGNGGDGRRRRRIREVLRPGEEILVQIVKEQFANKPPTLTTFYSLPGRYLVLLPGSDDAGISRRIEGEERIRVRKLISELNPPEGFGIIVRTAAGFDEDTGELARDLGYLQGLWENIRRAADARRAPALIYREQDLVLRTIRDFFTPDIDEIHIDNEEVFQRARDFLHNVMPGKEHVLHLYQGGAPIFSALGVESQIESIFKRRVPLRSGGTLVIDTTEALTAIDVNSGGSVRGPNPEDTAFRTNLEAAREAARQLRLRDIGGIIVVDFIDMREPSHIHEVERAMRDAMRADKARHEAGRISRLGLMEISRQRLRPAAMASSYTSCPMCEGHGAVRTTESAALVALRKIHNRVAQGDAASLKVALPTEVAVYLLNQKRDDVAQLEARYNTRIQVSLSDKLMPHQMDLEVRARPESERPPATVSPGAVTEPGAATEAQAAAPSTAATPAATPAGGKKRRRRRGGRRGRVRRAAAAIGEALAALGATAVPVQGNGSEQRDTEAVSPPSETAPARVPMEAQIPTAPGAPIEVTAPPARPAPIGERAHATRRSGWRGRRRGGRTTPAAAAHPDAAVGAAEPPAPGPLAEPPSTAPEPPAQPVVASAPAETTKKPSRRRRKPGPRTVASAAAAHAIAPQVEASPKRPRPSRGAPRKVAAEAATTPEATGAVKHGRSRSSSSRRKRKVEAEKPVA